MPDFSWLQIPNLGKCTKISLNIPNGRKICSQKAIKYTNIFHFQALQNLPKFGFLALCKNTIWQPWGVFRPDAKADLRPILDFARGKL
jgi:hypothetical protein